MKNYEKYADEIRKYKSNFFCSKFVEPNVLKPIGLSCDDLGCTRCHMLQTIWLMEEHEKPGVDWSKVKVDTPILVRDDECKEWERRHFAKYEDGIIYAWSGGNTSWSAEGHTAIWNYVKLAGSEDE